MSPSEAPAGLPGGPLAGGAPSLGGFGGAPGDGLDRALAAFGEVLRRNQRAIRAAQWVVVLCYLVLVAVPAFLPLPERGAHLWTNLTLFAQFAFWGLWWPFVLLSMVLVGRAWCGLLCPEGALSEGASRWSRGRAVPRWLTWRGWPFAAFVLTTLYGQMVSVYQYPKPALLVLGGSTMAAIAVGLVYGRDKRVWCRYLCPVNGVFELLAKLAPVSFQVDRAAWRSGGPPAAAVAGGRIEAGPARRARLALNCAPLVPVRTMRGAGSCHMCGRCSGYRGAVRLARRSPNHEIVRVAGDETNPWQTALILVGLMGVAVGAFHWTGSPLYVAARQAGAEWLVEHDLTWPLEAWTPWYVLTNYPAQNDAMSPLDGVTLVLYLAAAALGHGIVLGGLVLGAAYAAEPAGGGVPRRRFHHLAQTLIPVAGCGVFLGLSAITVTILRGEGFELRFVGALRAALLGGAALWSVGLAWQVAGLTVAGARRFAAAGLVAGACAVAVAGWVALFFAR